MFYFYVVISLAAVTLAAEDETNYRFVCPELPKSTHNYFVRDPRNCSVFYNCYNPNEPGVFSCLSSLVFSLSVNSCVYRFDELNDCDKKAFNGGRFNDELCSARPNGTNVDPDDCHRFIPCFNYTSYISMPCPSHLVYNFEMNQCIENTGEC